MITKEATKNLKVDDVEKKEYTKDGRKHLEAGANTKDGTKHLEAVDIEFENKEINEDDASSDNVAEDDTNSVDSDDKKNYKEIIDVDDDAVPVPSPNAITFD